MIGVAGHARPTRRAPRAVRRGRDRAGGFTKVNQNGATSPLPPSAGTTGWDVEEALDIDMVSAICPLCHITLVEATSPSNTNLYTAENSAVSAGAKFISNSWGGSEYSGETTDANNFFNHPGVAITVSAGDTPTPARRSP